MNKTRILIFFNGLFFLLGVLYVLSLIPDGPFSTVAWVQSLVIVLPLGIITGALGLRRSLKRGYDARGRAALLLLSGYCIITGAAAWVYLVKLLSK